MKPDGKQQKLTTMFRISRKELSRELALLAQIAGSKNVIPALSTVRFQVEEGVASLLASNGDVALYTEVPATGENWKGCVPAKQLYDIMRLAKTEQIEFIPQADLIQIKWDKARHRLPVIDFNKFPQVDAPATDGERLTVRQADLEPVLERVLACAARDDTTAWMVRGIKMEAKEGQLKLIATNTHRMGVASIPAEGELNVFVPLFAANLLPRLASETITIRDDGKQVSFSYGSRTLISRLLAGTFPAWEKFMPDYLPLNASFSTEEMIGALKRADVTRDETFKTGVGRILLSVVFIFGKDELVIDTKHSDVYGRSEESVSLTSNLNGDLVTMGINPDYVLDFLRGAAEKTEAHMKDGSSVLKLTDGSSFEYLVVPTRL